VKGWQVALLLGGVATAGGVVYFVTRPKKTAPPPPPASTSGKPNANLSNVAGNLIAQVGGRALSLGIDKLSDYASDLFG
jgi:hypothetical protein